MTSCFGVPENIKKVWNKRSPDSSANGSTTTSLAWATAIRGDDGYDISQAEYVANRLKPVDLPKGANAEDIIDNEIYYNNRTTVGCLSCMGGEGNTARPGLCG